MLCDAITLQVALKLTKRDDCVQDSGREVLRLQWIPSTASH